MRVTPPDQFVCEKKGECSPFSGNFFGWFVSNKKIFVHKNCRSLHLKHVCVKRRGKCCPLIWESSFGGLYQKKGEFCPSFSSLDVSDCRVQIGGNAAHFLLRKFRFCFFAILPFCRQNRGSASRFWEVCCSFATSQCGGSN